MADSSTTGAIGEVRTKNPSPLMYDKEKNKECKFDGVTTTDEKNKVKDCRKTVIYVDPEGYIRNADIKRDTVENIDIGQTIEVLNAIVLHRTGGSTALGAIAKYKNIVENKEHIGSHFVIDKNGDIYQTLDLSKLVQHVGPIRSKCEIEQTATPEELKKINELLHMEKGKKELSEYEKKKTYPIRYPWSGDSVGIEVASRYINGVWEAATAAKKTAINRLVDIITNIYELKTFDIYEHDQIARKTAGEGADLYTAKDYEHSQKNLKTKGQWVDKTGSPVRNHK